MQLRVDGDAIEVVPARIDRNVKQRFLQEAQAASALDHPNICTIHEINETDDGQLYLVMAHYEGETLKARIARGPLATRRLNSMTPGNVPPPWRSVV